MTIDTEVFRLNRAATEQMRLLADRCSDQQLGLSLGDGWTPAIAFSHLAFWDARVLNILENIERSGMATVPLLDDSLNDILIPFFAAIPPREAARTAITTAENLDNRLENFPAELLEALYQQRDRWVRRSLHRNEHLERIKKAIGG